MIRYYSQPKINNSPYPPHHTNPAGAQANVQECLQAICYRLLFQRYVYKHSSDAIYVK